MIQNYFTILLCFALLAINCSSQVPADEKENDLLFATLWYQRAQECKAIIASQYKLATLMLDKALQDKTWTAAPEEQKENFENKPPAIILDIDETVLDNSPMIAWLVAHNLQNNREETNKAWDGWTASAQAKALPGALEFIQYAQSKKVKVFFITNRESPEEMNTRKNLKQEGFVLDEDVDTVLLKKEKPKWGSKKGSRRGAIAENYRILLLVGDNLGDFIDFFNATNAERDQLLEKNKKFWGERWIALPNPLYGSWINPNFDFNFKLSPDQMRKLMKEKLIQWDRK